MDNVELYAVEIDTYNNIGLLVDERTGNYICSLCKVEAKHIKNLKHTCWSKHPKIIKMYFDFQSYDRRGYHLWSRHTSVTRNRALAVRISREQPNINQYVPEPRGGARLLRAEAIFMEVR